MKLLIVFALLCTVSSFGYGQMKISGVVNDTVNNRPMENAVVLITRISDSVLLDFQRTNSKGEFKFEGVEYGELELMITNPKYGDKSYYIIGSASNNEINIPNVILPEKTRELDEVVVFANKEPIYFKGDTLVYVADSFKVKPNAVVEDLLKKLPGIEVDENGKIKSQGQEVTKVLVDGDEFFGTDPTVATKNLGAEGVQTVEVYETTEDTGDGEETVQVMDVKLKEDAKKGYFGKVSGAGDVVEQKYYEGEVLFNRFSKDTKVSVFGLAGNTPNTQLSVRDAYKYGLTNELNMSFEDGMPSWNQTSRRQGLPQTLKGGVYYSDKIGKRLKLGANYTYNNGSVQQNTNSTSQFFLTDTTYNTSRDKFLTETQESHAVNLSLNIKLDTFTNLILEPSVNIKNMSTLTRDSSNFISAADIRTSSTEVLNDVQNNGLDLNGKVRLERKFKKRKRKFSAEYLYGNSDNSSEERLNSTVAYYNSGNPNLLTDQRKTVKAKTQGHRGLLKYTEPINRKVKLELEYKLDYFFGDQSKIARNGINGVYAGIDSTFSNSFSNLRLENRVGVGVRYETRKHNLLIGTKARNVKIDNENLFNNTAINQDIYNLLPYARYSIKFSNAHRLRFRYNTSSRQPSVNQLQPVPDNTNPNNLAVGNPDLVPTYAHNVSVGYNKWDALSQQYIWLNGYGTYTNHDFSSAIKYLPDGRTESKVVNVDGNFYAGLNAGAGLNFFKKLLKWSPYVGINYSDFNSVITNTDGTTLNNSTQNQGYNLGSQFEIDRDSISFGIGANVGYNIPKSDFSFNANQPYFTQSYKANFYVELPWKMELETDADYIINSNLTQGFNRTPLLINASIAKRFLKTENLIVSFEANDILNQNVGINRSIQNNVIIDQRTTIIARYFLLRGTLKFNNQKTKVKDEGYW